MLNSGYLIAPGFRKVRIDAGYARATRYQSRTTGDIMIYIYQILSAILIGVAIGTLLGSRNTIRRGGAIIGIVLALIMIFTGSWIYLLIGTAIYLLSMGTVRDGASHSRA